VATPGISLATVATAPVGGWGGAALGAAIGSVDDLMFTALELGTGYIIPEQALLQVGQTLLKAGVQTVMSGVMSGFGGADALNETATKIAGDTGKSITDVLASMDPLEKFGLGGLMGLAGDNWVGQAGAQLFNQVVSNTANGFIDAHSLEVEDGKVVGWHFDGDSWGDRVFGENALASYVGGVVNIGVKGLVEGLINNIDLKGIETGGAEIIQGLQNNVSKISSTIGGLAGEAVGSLIDGEFSINLLNLADFLAFLPGEQSEGMSDDFFSHLQKIKNNSSMGLFELNIGVRDDKAGVRSRIGSGGASINIMGLIQGFHSLGRLGAINAAAIEAREEVNNNLIDALIQSSEEEQSSTSPNPQDPGSEDGGNNGNSSPETDQDESDGGLFSGEEFNSFKEAVDQFDGDPTNATERLWEEVHGKGGAEKKHTLDLLIELIGIDKVNDASSFMRNYVLEEDLIAYDFQKFAMEIINSGELTKEAVAKLAAEVDSVNQLNVHFQKAFDTAIALEKKDLLNALEQENNDHIERFKQNIKLLQEAGLINSHMIFNPFAQTEYAKNQLAAKLAREKLFEDNIRAMGRMVRVREGGKEFFYIIDNQVENDWREKETEYEEGGAWNKLDAKVYKVEVAKFRSDEGKLEYDSIPIGIGWDRGSLKILESDTLDQSMVNWLEFVNLNKENIFNESNYVGLAGDMPFVDSDGNNLGITVENARMAGYKNQQVVAAKQAIARFFRDTRANYGSNLLAISPMDRVGLLMDLVGKAKTLKDHQGHADYSNYLKLKENGYQIIRSITWCNIGATGFAYEYHRESSGYADRTEFTSLVTNSLHSNAIADSSAFVEVSLDYAALWGKTNAFAFGRKFSADGRPGHISILSDFTLNNGDRSNYKSGDIYEYYFDNIGEWNALRLTMKQAWGAYSDEFDGPRNLNKFKSEVDFFVLAPGIR
jgi:hypothetical protein